MRIQAAQAVKGCPGHQHHCTPQLLTDTPCCPSMHAGIGDAHVLHLVRGKPTGNTQR